MRPEELARQLGISGKTLRGWLRWRFPRRPLEHKTSWFLTEDQVRAARLHFGGVYTPIFEGRPEDHPTGDDDVRALPSPPALHVTARLPDFGALQRGYEPTELRILFVGESPPASGRYFYVGNSLLYSAMRDAFEDSLGRGPRGGFLDFFQDLGCYLTDLSNVPVNQLPFGARERTAARRAGIPGLVDLIRERKPAAIVGVLLDIEPEIREALQDSGESSTVHLLPFPRGQERTRFVRQLSELLARFHEAGHLREGVIGN
jgi:hypothetical protein